MVVDASTFDTLRWLGLIVAAGLAIAFRVTPSGRSLRLLGLLAGIAVSLGIGFGLKHLGAPCVIVKITESAATEKRRVVVFGSPSHGFQDGHSQRLSPLTGTLVVNDSRREIELRTVSYGTMLGSGPEAIAPMSTFDAKYGVDYLGPDDTPPDEMRSKMGFGFKYWLTW